MKRLIAFASLVAAALAVVLAAAPAHADAKRVAALVVSNTTRHYAAPAFYTVSSVHRERPKHHHHRRTHGHPTAQLSIDPSSLPVPPHPTEPARHERRAALPATARAQSHQTGSRMGRGGMAALPNPIVVIVVRTQAPHSTETIHSGDFGGIVAEGRGPPRGSPTSTLRTSARSPASSAGPGALPWSAPLHPPGCTGTVSTPSLLAASRAAADAASSYHPSFPETEPSSDGSLAACPEGAAACTCTPSSGGVL